MKTVPIYYTVHQVASFYQIKRDTLYYYDRIGLFSPSKRASNGYRYYSSGQLQELEAILSLRELGLSIKAIREMLHASTIPEVVASLEKEQSAIQEKLAALSNRKNIITRLIALITRAREAEEGILYLEDFEKEYLYTVPIASNKSWDETYDVLMSEADSQHIIYIGSTLTKQDILAGNTAHCQSVYATFIVPTKTTRPKGRYACMYFHGPVENMNEKYLHYLDEVERMGLSVDETAYEDLAVSTLVTRNEDEYITRLAMRLV